MFQIINIIITQKNMPGPAGVSRDDIIANEEVTLTNEDNTGIDFFKWEIVSWAQEDGYGTAPDLSGYLTEEAKFTPLITGTYIIKLTINKDENLYGLIGVSINSYKLGLRFPTTGEYNEFEYGWQGILNSNMEIIEDHGIYDNASGEIYNIEEKK